MHRRKLVDARHSAKPAQVTGLIFTREDFEARHRAIEMRDLIFRKMQQMVIAAEDDGDDWLLGIGRKSGRTLIDGINANLPARFRRLSPGDVEPLEARGRPKKFGAR